MQNAVKSNRIAHAYIFCGPRGTGKTSTAKIYAKALNCLTPVSSGPCNECDNCRAITTGISVDVSEIDAASNRGIDEIRELREKVKFTPSNCRYKVYIIDEVHMLTSEAFNALLKTLEEPPSHVIFILATTEPHKVPLTVLSRCQRFDFKRIEQSVIIEKLMDIASAINLGVEPSALSLIARAAEGSLRDALCILEQGITFINAKSAFSEDNGQLLNTGTSEDKGDSYPGLLKEEDVHSILGTVREDLLKEMAEYLRKNDAGSAFKLIAGLEQSGKDIRLFIKDLTAFLRDFLLEVCTALPARTERFESARLMEIIEIMVWAEKEMRWSSQPRLILELAVSKACLLKPSRVSGDGLAWRVEELEQKLEDMNALLEQILSEGKVRNDNIINSKVKEEKREISSDMRETFGARSGFTNTRKNIDIKQNSDIDNKIEVEEIVRTDNDSLISLEQIKTEWGEVLSNLKIKSLPAYTLASKGEPVEIAGKLLTIGFNEQYKFDKERLESSGNKKLLEDTIKNVFGLNLEVRCKIFERVGDGLKNLSAKRKYKDEVEEVMNLFGAEETSLDGFEGFIALQFPDPAKKLND